MIERVDHLQAYVDVLGPDAAMDFLLHFGGGPIWLANDFKDRSSVVERIGRDRALALADRLGPGQHRVPTAKKWLARQLHARGETIVGIARRLHVSDVAVRSYVKGGHVTPSEVGQGDLFG